ncbi:MAG: hypothetical protein JXR76_23495 [Deltaproteobacteria bacterium]|nr:hypothetical protein [Deltaproteobacteria bacterium]
MIFWNIGRIGVDVTLILLLAGLMRPERAIAVVGDDAPVMRVLLLYPPTGCVNTEALQKNIQLETASLPVVFMSEPEPDKNVDAAGEQWLKNWLTSKEAHGAIWFTCSDGGIHLFAKAEDWLREDRHLAAGPAGMNEEVVFAVVEYWMMGIVPRWQKAKRAAEDDILDNPKESLPLPKKVTDTPRRNDNPPQPVNYPVDTSGITDTSSETQTGLPIRVREHHMNVEVNAAGVLIRKNAFLPGVWAGMSIKVHTSLELFTFFGLLKTYRVHTLVNQIDVETNIDSLSAELGARWLWTVKTGTADVSLGVDGSALPYETRVAKTGITHEGRTYQLSLLAMVGISLPLFPHGYLTIRGGVRVPLVRPNFEAKTSENNATLVRFWAVEPLILAGIGVEFL